MDAQLSYLLRTLDLFPVFCALSCVRFVCVRHIDFVCARLVNFIILFGCHFKYCLQLYIYIYSNISKLQNYANACNLPSVTEIVMASLACGPHMPA